MAMTVNPVSLDGAGRSRGIDFSEAANFGAQLDGAQQGDLKELLKKLEELLQSLIKQLGSGSQASGAPQNAQDDQNDIQALIKKIEEAIKTLQQKIEGGDQPGAA
jgi:hypothetical protein